MQADRVIHKISSPTGQLITDPELIYDIQLYSSKSKATDVDVAYFLIALDSPVPGEAARQEIDSDFMLEEIKTAIGSFANGKACGPDGFL